MKWSDWPSEPGVAVAKKITVQTTVTAANGHSWTSGWNYLWKETRSAKISISGSGIWVICGPQYFLRKRAHSGCVAKEILYTENVLGISMQRRKTRLMLKLWNMESVEKEHRGGVKKEVLGLGTSQVAML